MQNRLTLKEIAKKLNLSPSTISAIINNKPTCFASKKTKQKVLDFIQKVGYTPNLIARSLKKQKTNTIGFVAPFPTIDTAVLDIAIIDKTSWKKGYRLLIGYSYGDREKEEAILKELYSRQVDGIIIIPTGLNGENNFLRRLLTESFPIVSLTKIEGLNIDVVSPDYQKGGYIATEYLIKTGHKKIGFFGGSIEYFSIRERFIGYQNALKKYGLTLNKNITSTFFHQEDAKEEIYTECIKFISEKEKDIDSIFASNDRIAFLLIKAAKEKNIKIPGDISIIGFDDSEFVEYFSLGITTVGHPSEKISKTALNFLLDKIEGRRKKLKTVFFNPELVIRNSVNVRL
ncbi:MAG: LacI family transcriptional regulator [Candidatus Omnitrophica bacterium]|nr:LacI family transcriptional regulator [Candidatus Omnitrophota bacterium]